MKLKSDWLEPYTEAESIDLLRDLGTMAARLAGRRGQDLVSLIRKDDMRGIIFRPEIDYNQALDSRGIRELAYERQALALFTKNGSLDIGIDKRQAAIDAYLGYEDDCAKTNRVFRARASGTVVFRGAIERVLRRAGEIVRHTLGDPPAPSELRYRFGPGATTLIPKRESSTLRKLGTEIDCSEDLLPALATVLEEMPLLAELHASSRYVLGSDGVKHEVPKTVSNFQLKGPIGLEVLRTSVRISEAVLSFVLKNAKIDRTVEKQPALNVMVQLAYGDVMFARNKAGGLDLSDQRRNQMLARLGSLTGASATLDLKGASDTNAFWLVLELLRSDWFEALAGCRVGIMRHPATGERMVLEKFSAMGNGFTFPLESLIFWSLTLAVHEQHYNAGLAQAKAECSCYGDDLICPVGMVGPLTEVLETLGFRVNNAKSYSAGPFRESCGSDFYSGVDVRPVYVKDVLTPAALFTMHNAFKRRGMEELRAWCERMVAPHLRLYGPPGYGDGYLHAEAWPRTRSSAHLARGFEGSTFKCYSRVPKKDMRAEGLSSSRPGESILPAYQAYARSVQPITPDVKGLEYSNFPTIRRLKKTNPAFMRVNLLDRLVVEAPSDPLPDVKLYEHHWEWREDDCTEKVRSRTLLGSVKAPSFPGDDGYKVTSIYTLGV